MVQRGKGSSHRPPTGTWTLLDNSTGTVPGDVTYTGHASHVSGRITSSPWPGRPTVYLGSAGGGVWKTDDITAAHPDWHAIGADIPTRRSAR